MISTTLMTRASILEIPTLVVSNTPSLLTPTPLMTGEIALPPTTATSTRMPPGLLLLMPRELTANLPGPLTPTPPLRTGTSSPAPPPTLLPPTAATRTGPRSSTSPRVPTVSGPMLVKSLAISTRMLPTLMVSTSVRLVLLARRLLVVLTAMSTAMALLVMVVMVVLSTVTVTTVT